MSRKKASGIFKHGNSVKIFFPRGELIVMGTIRVVKPNGNLSIWYNHTMNYHEFEIAPQLISDKDRGLYYKSDTGEPVRIFHTVTPHNYLYIGKITLKLDIPKPTKENIRTEVLSALAGKIMDRDIINALKLEKVKIEPHSIHKNLISFVLLCRDNRKYNKVKKILKLYKLIE